MNNDPTQRNSLSVIHLGHLAKSNFTKLFEIKRKRMKSSRFENNNVSESPSLFYGMVSNKLFTKNTKPIKIIYLAYSDLKIQHVKSVFNGYLLTFLSILFTQASIWFEYLKYARTGDSKLLMNLIDSNSWSYLSYIVYSVFPIWFLKDLTVK